MSMFGGRAGSWWLRSKKDPRWNGDGRSEFMVVTAEMFSEAGMCSEAEAALKEMKSRLGNVPKDLEYGCMKD